MATKKGGGTRSRKPAASKSKGAGKAKRARPAKGKSAHKAKSSAKAKSPAKAKSAHKTKSASPRKAEAKRAAPPKRVAPAAEAAEPQVLDEVIEEPILDASGILKIKDAYARSHHDQDEGDTHRFPDPSLVVEAEADRAKSRTEDGESSLFDEEARRQDERGAPTPPSGSLFGALKKKPEA